MAERLIGMLIFPRLTQLDMTGPYEVLARLPNTKVHLVAHTMAPVKTDRGMEIVPTTTLADCPQLDLVMVPGGPGQQDLMEDAAALAFLRKQARGVKYLTSVCTGSLVLGAAGLLKGKRATCHWAAIDHLKLLGAIPVSERVVTDGNIITGAGVASGIDFALAVAAVLEGEEWRGRSSCRSSTIRRRRSIPARPRPHPPRRGPAASRGAALNEQRREVAQRVGRKLGVS